MKSKADPFSNKRGEFEEGTGRELRIGRNWGRSEIGKIDELGFGKEQVQEADCEDRRRVSLSRCFFML